jgi:hypothetical protein
MNPAPESLCLPEKSDSKLLPKKGKNMINAFKRLMLLLKAGDFSLSFEFFMEV